MARPKTVPEVKDDSNHPTEPSAVAYEPFCWRFWETEPLVVKVFFKHSAATGGSGACPRLLIKTHISNSTLYSQVWPACTTLSLENSQNMHWKQTVTWNAHSSSGKASISMKLVPYCASSMAQCESRISIVIDQRCATGKSQDRQQVLVSLNRSRWESSNQVES